MKRSSLLAGVLSLVALVAATQAAAEQWVRKNDAPDPFVRNIRVFSNTPAAGQTTVYAGTMANGVIKIVDSGASQEVNPVNNGLPVLRIRAVNGPNAMDLYAGTDGHGIYKTTDGGANWVSANGSGGGTLGCRFVRNINVRTALEVWAETGCLHNSGVYRTLDGGDTWSRLGASVIPDDATVGSAAFFGIGESTVAVVATARNGLFRSADNGVTWTQINSGLPAPNGANNISVFNAAFLANASQMLAYVEGHGLFRTLDGGTNWNAFGTGYPASAHALGGIQRQSPTLFFIGTDKGPVYRTTDGGATWSPFGNSGSDNIGQFVRSVASDTSGRTYLSGQIGLGRTTDGGSTFTFINIGQGYASDMILDPDGKRFYLAVTSLYRIPDLYAPFGPDNDGVDIGTGLPGSLVNGSIAQVKTQPSTMFAGLNNFGLYKTSDGGANWAKLDLPNVQVGTNPVASVSPSNGQVVYAYPGNKYGTAGGGGLFKSVDGGSTWADSSTGLATPEARDVNSIAQHQDAPSALVIATGDGLYRSSDGGANWTATLQITDDQATKLPMSSVRFHPFDPQVLYAAANHVNPDGTVRASSGIHKSVDGGQNWTQVLSGKRTSSVRVEGTGRVVALLNRDLSQAALLASVDGGTTWAAFNNGIVDNDGMMLATSSREQGAKVAFASMTTGMYVLDQRPPRLVNIATRGKVGTGANVLIAGFIIGGDKPKKVLITARGPSVAVLPSEVPLLMADPSMVLYSGPTPIDSNDDWQLKGNSGEIPLTMRPGNVKDAAILTTLNPGAYTAIVSGVNNTEGLAIVEVFEVENPELPLVNIATRGRVGTGANVLIAGFIIQGDAPKTVVVTARGQSTAVLPSEVPLLMADPYLRIYSGASVIHENDDWESWPTSSSIPLTQRPGHAKDAAVLVTLPPGAYTAIVTGVNDGEGIGIVEVFAQ